MVHTVLLAGVLAGSFTSSQIRPGEQRLRAPRPAAPTTSIGFFKLVGGLSSETEVVEYKEGGLNNGIRRIPGSTAGTSFRVGLLSAPEFNKWIEDYFMGKGVPVSGAVQTSDPAGNVMARREFSNALITEIGFPALDSASSERGYLTVTITPERTKPGNPEGLATIHRDPNARQKTWLCCNFRLELGNLPTARVSKVDAFTVKQGHVYQHNQTDLEFLKIRCQVPEAEFSKWPVKATGPDLKAAGNEVAIETLEIAHEGLKMGSLDLTDPTRRALARLDFTVKDLRADGTPQNGMRRVTVIAIKPRFRFAR